MVSEILVEIHESAVRDLSIELIKFARNLAKFTTRKTAIDSIVTRSAFLKLSYVT
jgi:hypothetical protein